jgi:hypothetical protein
MPKNASANASSRLCLQSGITGPAWLRCSLADMRAFAVIITFLALGVVGCSTERASVSARDFRDPSLEPLVGQRVTLRGTLRSPGKFGPFLVVGQTAVYMKPLHMGEIYHYGKIYDELDGRKVEITGTLHFEHYPVVHTPPGVAPAVDHYWFEDETVQIRAVASVP